MSLNTNSLPRSPNPRPADPPTHRPTIQLVAEAINLKGQKYIQLTNLK